MITDASSVRWSAARRPGGRSPQGHSRRRSRQSGSSIASRLTRSRPGAQFRQGLKESGYVEGENVAIEYRYAEAQFDRLPAFAAELVRRQVAVFVAANTPSVLAAKAVTTTIPIVFNVAEDGQAWSCRQPGPPGRQPDGRQFFQW